MKYRAFRMDFTPGELGYFLFKKKICPRCGGRMDRSKTYETRYGYEFPSSREPMFAAHEPVKYYFYVYTCRECGAAYRLSDLAK